MSQVRTVVAAGFALLALLLGVVAPATAGADPLGRHLAANGKLDLTAGFTGTLDPAGYRMLQDAGGAPRFVADSKSTPTKLFGVPDGCDDDVRAIVRAPSGLIYLAGDFTICEDVRAPHVVAYDPVGRRFLALGSHNANGVDGTVFALALSGDDLYVAGAFSNAGGQPANRIARWDGGKWTTLGEGIDGVIGALAVAGNGDLFVGGEFQQAGGQAARSMARWNGSDWAALGSGIQGEVKALAVNGNQLYAGGNFAQAGGLAANNVARWDGQNWSALGTGAGSREPGQFVHALAVAGTDLYVGGGFVQAGGIAAIGVARWNGASWSSLGSGEQNGVDNEVFALAVSGSQVYVGGAFQNAGGRFASRIARFDGTRWFALGGGSDPEVNGVDSVVNAILVSGTDLYAVGLFTTADGIRANRFARFDGLHWAALGSGTGEGVNGFVRALAVFAGQLYVAGEFTQAGGRPANNIASWNGSTWSTLGSGTNNGVLGEVGVLAVMGNSLYVAGAIDSAGGQPVNNIARWDGSSWSALGTGVNRTVGALTVLGNDLYAGGLFDQAGGQPASLVARWDGSRWFALGTGIGNPQAGEFVVALTSFNGQLHAGGNFTRAGSAQANHVARWDGNQWSALGAGTDFYVYTLATFNSSLYAGGAFNMAGGIPAAGIARWDGQRWQALGDPQGVSNIVLALQVSGPDLYVGGSFRFAGGLASNGLARWNGSTWFGLGLDQADQIVTVLASDGSNLFVNGNGLTQTPLPQLQSAGADAESLQPAVSRSADVLVFSSKAGNLVPAERNPRADVFLRTGSGLQRISDLALSLDGGASQDFERPSISADGAVVAFQGSSGQVYSVIGGAARPLAAGGNGRSASPATSADGTRVAFESIASNLSSLDRNGAVSDVFVADVTGATRELVSISPGGVAGNGPSFAPSLSGNGRVIAFVTLADNLSDEIFAKATSARQIVLNNQSAGGVASVLYVSRNLTTRALGNGDSDAVKLTPDGRFGVFQSSASNLVEGDSNGVSDIFRFEIGNNRVVRLERISRSAIGVQANGPSRNPTISDDGQFISYETDASNLVVLDINGRTDIVVHSIGTGETLRLSRTTDGAQPNGASNRPAISGDGSTIAFDSTAANFAAGDNNGVADVFAVELRQPEGLINYTGAWFDPAQSGHGLFMEQLPGNQLLAWWFTFDPQGRQAWFGGVGTLNGSQAQIPVTRTDGPGGRFIPNFNSSQVSNVPFGSLTINFASCDQGRVEFDLGQDFARGGMDLMRLTQPDDVGGCRRGTPTPASTAAPGAIGDATGAWFDPAQAGQGLFLESLPGGQLLAYWFTFNPGGGQAWFGSVGPITGQTADIVPIKTAGGRWIPNFDPAQVSNPALGTMRIQFSSCTQGLVTFNLQQGFGQGSMVLQRLTAPVGQTCGL